MSFPRMCVRAAKNSEVWSCFYSVLCDYRMDPMTCMLPVMLPILLEPACPVFILRLVLLFSLVALLRARVPATLLSTGTHSPVGRLAFISSGVPAVFISGTLAPFFEFLPQLATKQPANF